MNRVLNVLLLIILTLLISCKEQKGEPGLVHYFIFDKMVNHSTREYVCIDDTSAKISITQDVNSINDTVCECKYLTMKLNSIPISSGVERYYENGNIELVALSYFEYDSNDHSNRSFDAQIIGEKKLKPNERNIFEVLYKFKTDTALTMKTQCDFIYTFFRGDTLNLGKGNYLIERVSTKTSLSYSDNRNSNVFRVGGIRIFSENKGLIYFTEQLDSLEEKAFKIKE